MSKRRTSAQAVVVGLLSLCLMLLGNSFYLNLTGWILAVFTLMAFLISQKTDK